MDIAKLYQEVTEFVDSLDVEVSGPHLYSNYQKVTGILIRLGQIRNDIAFLELTGHASPQAKKFRTTILEKTIDDLEKVAQYESRRITAMNIENMLDR